MGNPLTEEEILRFETHCNIRLPEASRMFLKEIGNGCVMIDGFRLMGMDEMD
ncbi:SMI1/KNR4 family protein [Clostridium transplantifaecale]|uniref:SMI1/KNR4 family protein n=1 Tax=Clostridium transplantifaecale TaxID=2479838 RepID=UPI001FA98924|nr:SMI1/KNR4 family protein [Clostridium transplantifaecale]